MSPTRTNSHKHEFYSNKHEFYSNKHEFYSKKHKFHSKRLSTNSRFAPIGQATSLRSIILIILPYFYTDTIYFNMYFSYEINTEKNDMNHH